MYPARAMATGDVRATGGTSGNLVVGSLAHDVSMASSPGGTAAPGAPASVAYEKGALVLAAVAPGIAPYVSARVGLGERFEGGVTYTGREAHLDVRRSFDWDDVSLSIGLGVETPIYTDADTNVVPGIDLKSLSGYGADVPVVVGWQSSARVYMLWGGVRGGFDHASIGSFTNGADASLSADRLYAGGVVGLAAGFRHVHVGLELDVAYQSVSGTFGPNSVSVQGVSMAPSGALWWNF